MTPEGGLSPVDSGSGGPSSRASGASAETSLVVNITPEASRAEDAADSSASKSKASKQQRESSKRGNA